MLLATLMGIRTTYPLLIIVLFDTLAYVVIILMRLEHSGKIIYSYSISKSYSSLVMSYMISYHNYFDNTYEGFIVSALTWKIIYIILSLIPTSFSMSVSNELFGFFIPLTGRIGSNKIPDIIIGFATVIATLLTLTPYVSCFFEFGMKV